VHVLVPDIDVVALAQPRLGLLWFVPFGMFLTPGSGQPTPFQTSWTLLVALVTFALAIRATRAAISEEAGPAEMHVAPRTA